MYGLAYCRLDYEYMMDLDLGILSKLLKAEIDRETHERDVDLQLLAWQTAYLMNATGNFKRPIKPEKLYKSIDKSSKKHKQNKDSVKEEKEKLKKRFNL